MEIFDLYTAERERTGKTMIRGEAVPDGYYRLVVHICIFNEDGRMLIQQRQSFKRGFANLWDISVGGSAIAGETSREAAQRETGEELGLDIDFSGIRPSITVHWDHGFDDYYVLTRNVNPETLHLQEEEVQAARWATREEILQMIEARQFVPYAKSMIDLLFFHKDTRSSLVKMDVE